MTDPEVFVGLTLRGDFDPGLVTQRLDLEPTHAHAKGARMSERTGRTAENSVWSIDSQLSVEADTIEPHLQWLLDLIEPRAEALSVLVAEGTFAFADCYWASAGMSGGPWVEPGSMRRLADLQLPLIISFYAAET